MNIGGLFFTGRFGLTIKIVLGLGTRKGGRENSKEPVSRSMCVSCFRERYRESRESRWCICWMEGGGGEVRGEEEGCWELPHRKNLDL